MFSMKKVLLILCLSALLAACGSPPLPTVTSTSAPLPTATSAPIIGPVVPIGEPEKRNLDQTVEIVSNCGLGGGTVVKHPSMTVLTNHAVEWEYGGEAGVGFTIGEGIVPFGVDFRAALDGHNIIQFEQGVQQSLAWDLPAAPNENVQYTLTWQELWQRGTIDIKLADLTIKKIDVAYRVAIQSEIVDKIVTFCGDTPANDSLVQAATVSSPTDTPQPTETPQPTLAPTNPPPTAVPPTSLPPTAVPQPTSPPQNTGLAIGQWYTSGNLSFVIDDVYFYTRIRLTYRVKNVGSSPISFQYSSYNFQVYDNLGASYPIDVTTGESRTVNLDPGEIQKIANPFYGWWDYEGNFANTAVTQVTVVVSDLSMIERAEWVIPIAH